jgi:hypothetical protein
MPSFAEHLKTLPGIDSLAALELYDPHGVLQARIENKPGSQGSVAVYAHLAQLHGQIDAAAAQAGLLLYAEHTADAQAHPGKHPNIDRLLGIVAGQPALEVRRILL